MVVLGDRGVGKTCLVLRFIEGFYSSVQQSTVGAFFLTKKVTLEDGQKMTMQLWDTAGQERYRAMAPMYYRNANAAVVCFDVGDEASFAKMKDWIDELKKNVPDDSLVLAIASNKADKVDEERVRVCMCVCVCMYACVCVSTSNLRTNSTSLPLPPLGGLARTQRALRRAVRSSAVRDVGQERHGRARAFPGCVAAHLRQKGAAGRSCRRGGQPWQHRGARGRGQGASQEGQGRLLLARRCTLGAGGAERGGCAICTYCR